MDDSTVNEMVAALCEVYPGNAFRESSSREVHDATLARLLTYVPAPSSWTVVRRGLASAMMLTDTLLFTLVVDRINDEGHPDALLTSCWPDGQRAAVEVRWDALEHTSEGGGYTTHWSFRLADEEPIALVGFVTTSPQEHLDRTEIFARALARKVGWRLAG